MKYYAKFKNTKIVEVLPETDSQVSMNDTTGSWMSMEIVFAPQKDPYAPLKQEHVTATMIVNFPECEWEETPDVIIYTRPFDYRVSLLCQAVSAFTKTLTGERMKRLDAVVDFMNELGLKAQLNSPDGEIDIVDTYLEDEAVPLF